MRDPRPYSQGLRFLFYSDLARITYPRTNAYAHDFLFFVFFPPPPKKNGGRGGVGAHSAPGKRDKYSQETSKNRFRTCRFAVF